MTTNFKIALTIILLNLSLPLLKAQSTSVFDATYFNKDNAAPPIKIGKGFHMNDIYKQTRSCFTSETCNPNTLTAQQTGGKKTSIRLYYTRTNQEYNSLLSQGASGKISFLNLFTLGGQKLEEFANTEIHENERLIFTAKVDFGIYSFENDPVLLTEAKDLITQNKLLEFVKMYGTHYISGIRKESSISVILTKKNSQNSTGDAQLSGVSISGKIPFRVSGSLEISDQSWANTQLNDSQFSVTVEVNGPEIEQSTIQNKINNILSGNEQNKADAISEIVSSAIKNISDPKQSFITQYYYSPFSLYGLEGIYWDEKKQNQLIKLNEAVFEVYSAKSKIAELISPSGKSQLEAELRNNNLDQVNTDKIMQKFNEIIPSLITLNQSTDKYLQELEVRYQKCSNVYCQSNSACCENGSYLTEISNFNFDAKIQKEMDKLMATVYDVAKDVNTPECEKKQYSTITVNNLSSNPYHLYNGDKFLETMPGKSSKSFNVNKGTYNFKAVQKSGYVMYPTENYRTAKITATCQEIALNVGFED